MTDRKIPIEAPTPAIRDSDGGRQRHSTVSSNRLGKRDEGVRRGAANLDGASPESDKTRSQDTPGKPGDASSRQQTKPDQATLTGSEELDARSRR